MSIGAKPAYVKWDVVRGDTSVLRVEFYDQDEKTPYDTTGWTFLCTVFDRRNNTLTHLDVEAFEGFIKITAPPAITEQWGDGFNTKVTQLDFDVEVTIDDEIVWTPVIGIVSVIGDITGRSV
jgi:hypothetical protein